MVPWKHNHLPRFVLRFVPVRYRTLQTGNREIQEDHRHLCLPGRTTLDDLSMGNSAFPVCVILRYRDLNTGLCRCLLGCRFHDLPGYAGELHLLGRCGR